MNRLEPSRKGTFWRQAGAMVLGVAFLLTAYRMALISSRGITLFVDEAYYWDWSRSLAFGYFTKPPVIAWLIALGTSLWGDSVLGVKAMTMLLYPATAGVIYRLGAELWDARTGAVAALLFITSPLAGVLGLAASTDAPLLLCWSAAAWALWRAWQGGGWGAWLSLGAALGMGLLSKYTMAAFALSALLLLAPACWQRARRLQSAGFARLPGPLWGSLAALVLALLLVAPHLLWNWQHGAPTLRHTAEITTAALQPGGWRALAEFLASQALMLGPLALLALLFNWGPGWRRCLADAETRPMDGLCAEPNAVPRAKPTASHQMWRGMATLGAPSRFVLALTLPLLLLAALQAWHARANANWAAPAFVGAALGLAHLLCPMGQPMARRWLTSLLASNLLLLALVCHAREITQGLRLPLPERADLFVRMRGWDTAFAALAPSVAAHPGWPLLVDGRTLGAQAAYHWRAMAVRPQALPGDGPARDQYELTTDARRLAGRPVLLLGEDGPPPRLVAQCRSVEVLGRASVAVGPQRQLVLSLSACEGWLARPGSSA